MKKRNDVPMQITVNKIFTLMKKVNLNGLIEDMVAEIKGKEIFVEAIDLSNSIIVVSSEKVFKHKMDKETIGMVNIDILMKFFSNVKEKTISFTRKDNNIVFSGKNSNRKMKFIIAADPEMVPTKLEKDKKSDDTRKVFTEMQEYKTSLGKEEIQDIITYISLSQSKETIIKCSDKEMIITIGNDNENQFEVIVDDVEELDGSEGDEVESKIYGEYLSRILSVINLKEGEEISLYVSDEKPVLIIEKNTMWALLQISEE